MVSKAVDAPKISLDHLVIAAESLETGQVFVRSRLGVTVPKGGVHDHMATHNCIGRIGKDIYLEIIAVYPGAEPDRTRWFALDQPQVQNRLKREGAFLHHWVVNSTDIACTLANTPGDTGPAIAMSRGDLNWTISVRDDGALLHDGLLPTVIEWPDIPHPSGKMTDLNIRLDKVTLHSTDPEDITASLTAMRADHCCEVDKKIAPANKVSATFIRGTERLTL